MIIRPMTEEDREVCIPMVLAFYDSPAAEHPAPPDAIQRSFADAVGPNPHISGFVLELDGQAVGFAYLTFFYSCEVGGNTVMIEELFVREELRGRGLGQQFLDWLYRAYPDVVRFRLEVAAENRDAIRLYQRNGFRPLSYGQMVKDRG